MIVDVHCEDDTVQIARIVHEHAGMYAVNFLEEKKRGVYDFSSLTELVCKESISGFYDVDNLEDTDLYMKVQGGYVLMDDSEDEDYVCSDSDVSESESLDDDEEDGEEDT
jgi:hypothetical protein